VKVTDEIEAILAARGDVLTAAERATVEGLRGDHYSEITRAEVDDLIAIIDRLAPKP
jgi:hypothetical protein